MDSNHDEEKKKEDDRSPDPCLFPSLLLGQELNDHLFPFFFSIIMESIEHRRFKYFLDNEFYFLSEEFI